MCDFIKGNESFEKLLKNNNIKHQFSILNHPQTNGSIEKFYRTIEEEFMRHYQNKKTFSEIKSQYYAFNVKL